MNEEKRVFQRIDAELDNLVGNHSSPGDLAPHDLVRWYTLIGEAAAAASALRGDEPELREVIGQPACPTNTDGVFELGDETGVELMDGSIFTADGAKCRRDGMIELVGCGEFAGKTAQFSQLARADERLDFLALIRVAGCRGLNAYIVADFTKMVSGDSRVAEMLFENRAAALASPAAARITIEGVTRDRPEAKPRRLVGIELRESPGGKKKAALRLEGVNALFYPEEVEAGVCAELFAAAAKAQAISTRRNQAARVKAEDLKSLRGVWMNAANAAKGADEKVARTITDAIIGGGPINYGELGMDAPEVIFTGFGGRQTGSKFTPVLVSFRARELFVKESPGGPILLAKGRRSYDGEVMGTPPEQNAVIPVSALPAEAGREILLDALCRVMERVERSVSAPEPAKKAFRPEAQAVGKSAGKSQGVR